MIVVFGSINMDLFFNPERAPEAGETVLMKGYQTFPGGKGANQAVAAARMGSETHFAGCVGRDGFSAELIAVLRDHNVGVDNLQQVETPTGTAVVIVDSTGENRILVASGANRDVHTGQIPDSCLVPGNTLLMQMEIDPSQIKEMVCRAQGRVDRVILNLAPALPVDGETLDHVDILIMNEVEIVQLAEHLGVLDAPEYEADALASTLSQRYELTCVVTLGADGAIAFSPDGMLAARVNSLALDQVIDTTGAGDAFCGTLAAGLDQGMTLALAMEFACAAGSLACLKPGAMASYPTREEVRARVPTIPALAA